MNLEQAGGIARIAFSVIWTMWMAPWLSKHGFSADQLQAINGWIVWLVTGSVPVAMMVWSVLAHSRQAKLKAVEAMPEVKRIEVSAVDLSMAEAIHNTSRPKVVLAEHHS